MAHIVLEELDKRWGRKLVLAKLSWNYKSSKNGAFAAKHPRFYGGILHKNARHYVLHSDVQVWCER